MRLAAALILGLSLTPYVSAHRLDEYLQAALFSVEKDRVQVSMRLIPGVAVSSTLLAKMDANRDGVLSESEQRAYADRLLADLSLSVDGQRLQPRLLSMEFPKIADMQEGLGEIHLDFSAQLPASGAANRRLIFENHHESRVSAYLVNCLVPRDRDIRIVAQNRNELQSYYQLNYVQSGSQPFQTPMTGAQYWFHGFAGMFRLGMRHIAEGTDHLLFLLALLLPAPLVALRSSWSGFAGLRTSLLKILTVVTAFTIGHSITLALAALGVVRVPSRPTEVLVAVSILISAAHALGPIFPGREAFIAAFFGLIHGLAFASTLSELGLGRWERVVSVLGFNIGIETMQLVVVAATMPSLILLARTRAYPVFRISGALFAGLASLGWIAQRLLLLPNLIDTVVDNVAHHALWIAVGLFLLSLTCRAWTEGSASTSPGRTIVPYGRAG
jgi:hypothetical protein